jgi:type IV pilus assembly protein PilY1
MTTFFRSFRLRRLMAAAMSILLALGPAVTPAYAAVTDLADEAIAARTKVAPNIMLTVDDSTSMLYDFLPDYVVDDRNRDGTGDIGYCRGVTGTRGAGCGSQGGGTDYGLATKYLSPGYIFQQYNLPYKKYIPAATTFDVSGPGSGCDVTSPQPRCSSGFDFTSGGADVIGAKYYPTTSAAARSSDGVDALGNPKTKVDAAIPYEYWLLWPAPAHNAAFNKAYYDPAQTYLPPIDRTTLQPYPNMNAANTTNWTSVPADGLAAGGGYATTNVDLTEKVTVGLWCNTDWSQDLVLNADGTFKADAYKYCRTNGHVIDSATGLQADYSYPRPPQGGKANDTSWKVGAPPTYTPAASWTAFKALANAGDYFYQNDNVIWCKPSAAVPPPGVTCNTVTPTCSATTNGTCALKQSGSCPAVTAATCAGGTAQTCNGLVTQVCNGAQPACTGVAQTCGAGTAQTCNSVTQTCNGAATQTCNITTQTQTCNVDNATCVSSFVPAGCNLLPPDPEGNPCTLATTCSSKCSISGANCTNNPGACTDIVTGKCSVTGVACTAANAATTCPALTGTCSSTGVACTTANAATACPTLKKCSSSGADCSVTACPAVSRKCSIVTTTDCTATGICASVNRCGGVATNPSCTTAPNNCSFTGTCSTTGVACTSTSAGSAGNCPASGTGTCSSTGLACTAANAATVCVNINKTCDNNSTTPGAACTINANCTTKARVCTNNLAPANTACTAASQCSVYQCDSTSGNSGTTCKLGTTVLAACTGKNGTCANSSNNGTACTSPTNALGECLPKAGTCSNNGLSCTAADLSNCTTVVTPASSTCSTLGANGVATQTLLDDASGAGLSCRRNNKDYAGVAAAPNNYPDATYSMPIAGGSCKITPRYVKIARHYWKTSVEWCDTTMNLAGDKWEGYGKAGNCILFRDKTHEQPRFHKFGTAQGTDNYATPAFERVDLIDTGKKFVHSFTEDGDPVTVSRDFGGSTPDVSEMTNYANWFAYYRTRIQAVKTVTSLAYNTLNIVNDADAAKAEQYVGLHTLSNKNVPSSYMEQSALTASNFSSWLRSLYQIQIPLGNETPTLDAMVRVGQYFKADGGLASTVDPIRYSCQKNWHLLFTDGITNQKNPPAFDVGNQDDTIKSLPKAVDLIGPLGAPTTVKAGDAWPALYRENDALAVGSSASDYAAYYWVTDLRNDALANGKNNVPALGTRDPAEWQHLNFSAMSLGTQGKLPSKNTNDVQNTIRDGTEKWTKLEPTPTKKDAKVPNQPDESGVDDLWHASVIAGGGFVNAENADELKKGMGKLLKDTGAASGARIGVGFNSTTLSGADNAVYRARFETVWSGNVKKIEIDPATGEEVKTLWDASFVLGSKLKATVATPQPWFTSRIIVTRDATGKPVPFLWAKLSASQQGSLAPGNATRGQNILAFLRGSTEKESDTKKGGFRERASSFLGDIVNSQPVYVGPPAAPYNDTSDVGYSGFKASNKDRAKRVYVGANDGMLHAFDDATGDEAWAYVPPALYRKPDDVPAAITYPGLLGALAFPTNELESKHRFLVDGPIRVTDVDFSGGSGTDWRSLLVAGLGKGGKSFSAIDVTDPGSVKTEDDAAAKLLWEFNDADLGYSFGRPLITKTNAFGKKWLVVVSSGYNNATGVGKLWFLDAKTGAVLKMLSTNAGSSDAPSGLAQIAGYTKSYWNYLSEQIYGGDLLGNFWRFDVSDADEANWKVEKLATFTSPTDGSAQSITTPPQIEIDIANGIDRWVFVGTGRLLAESDRDRAQVQTMYALRDGTTYAPKTLAGTLSRGDLVAVTDAKGLGSRPDNGWYDDLPTTPIGQRILVAPQAAVSVVVYTASYPPPPDEPCAPGLGAFLYAREFARGRSLLFADGGGLLESVRIDDGSVGIDVQAIPPSDDGPATGVPPPWGSPPPGVGEGSESSEGSCAGGTPQLAVRITTATGQTITRTVRFPNITCGHRMSWRLIGE